MYKYIVKNSNGIKKEFEHFKHLIEYLQFEWNYNEKLELSSEIVIQ